MLLDFTKDSLPAEDAGSLDFSAQSDPAPSAPDFSAYSMPADQPQRGFLSDKARRIGEGAAEGAAGMVEGGLRSTAGVLDTAADVARFALTAGDREGRFSRRDAVGQKMLADARSLGTPRFNQEAEEARLRSEQGRDPRLANPVSETLREGAATVAEFKQDQREVYSPDPARERDFSSKVAGAVGSSLPTLVTTLASGGAALPSYGTSALQLYQEGFDSAVAAGATTEKAHASGMLQMPLAYFEKVGDIRLGSTLRTAVETAFTKVMAKKPLLKVAAEAGKGLVIDGFGESVSEMAQTAGRQVVENELLGIKDQTAGERLSEVAEAGTVAFAAGAALGAPKAVTTVAGNASRPDKVDLEAEVVSDSPERKRLLQVHQALGEILQLPQPEPAEPKQIEAAPERKQLPAPAEPESKVTEETELAEGITRADFDDELELAEDGPQGALSIARADDDVPLHLKTLGDYIASPEAKAVAEGMAKRFAEQLNGDPVELAADALQTVYEKGARGGYRDTSKPPAHFVARVLRNHFIDQTRGGRQLREALSLDKAQEGELSVQETVADASAETPDAQTSLGELHDIIREVHDELDPVGQQLLLLRADVGMKPGDLSELARQHKITPQAVQQKQEIIRQKMSEALTRSGYDPAPYMRVSAKLDEAEAQEAKAQRGNRMAGKMGLNPIFDPDFYLDLIDHSVDVARALGRGAKKAVKFSVWAAKMTAIHGKRIVPHLKTAWAGMRSRFTPSPAGGPRMSRVRMPRNWGAERLLDQVGLKDLSKRMRTWEDERANTAAKLTDGYAKLQERYTNAQMKQARAEAEHYIRLRERGAKNPGDVARFRMGAENYLRTTSAATQDLVAWMKDTANNTGAISRSLNIMVNEGGRWRPMRDLGENHFPRALSKETLDLIQDPDKNATTRARYDQLLRDMVANGNSATEAEADQSLRRGSSTKSGGDFFGNVDKARGYKLPDTYYDYSTESYLSFLRRFSERVGQVAAFGQRTDVTPMDAFDEAKTKTTDQRLQNYIERLQGVVYQERANEPMVRGARAARKVSQLAYMTGTMTPVRNLISAVGITAETYGYMNTALAGAKAFRDSATAAARSFVNLLRGDARASTPEIVRVAEELGALQRDFRAANLMDLDFNGGTLDWLVSKGMYVNGLSERLGRSINAAAAMTWMRHTREIVAKGDSNQARARKSHLKKLGYDNATIARLIAGTDNALNERFVRDAVREKQFGYTANQAPIAMDSEWGKFFFQFQKWGFQRVRDLDRNVIQPMFEKVDGKNTVNLMPLLRMALYTIGFGELYNELRKWLFGKEPRMASLEEIERTYAANEKLGIKLALSRVFHDAVMEGGLGAIGDNLSLLKEFTERGRWKNPLDPPAFGLLHEIGALVTKRMQRGATMDGLGRDINSLLLRFPLAAQVQGATLSRSDSKSGQEYRARNEITHIRSMARRFANETGRDSGRRMDPGRITLTANSETYDSLNEALMRGNTADAKRIINDFLGDTKNYKERKVKLQALKSSVDARHPFRIPGVESADDRGAFLRWAQQRVPGEAARIKKAAMTYELAAKSVGLQ